MRLQLDAIELQAGTFRLGPLSLETSDGEYLVMLGPTGAGKTLTLEAIAGIRAVGAGRILMDGRDATSAAPEERHIGFLYQDSLLFPHLSVADNVAYGAHRLPRSQRAPTVARLARMLGIDELLGRGTRGLSGGERQRVALARALASNPVLLLLDEPLAALDPNSREALQQTLLALHRELGTTTIHVTHSFAEALALGDRVAVVMAGRVHQAGRPHEVFSAPASDEVARFLRAATAAYDAREMSADAPTIALGALTLWARDGTGAPQFVADAAAVEAGGDTDRAHAITGRILAVEQAGSRVRIRLGVGVEVEAAVTSTGAAPPSLRAGADVWVRLPRGR
jgi:ABC-type sugar transport system ATPase subunit